MNRRIPPPSPPQYPRPSNPPPSRNQNLPRWLNVRQGRRQAKGRELSCLNQSTKGSLLQIRHPPKSATQIRGSLRCLRTPTGWTSPPTHPPQDRVQIKTRITEEPRISPVSAKLLHPRCILRPASPQCHEWPREPLRSVSDKTASPTIPFLLGLIPRLAGARSASVFSTVGYALR